MRFSIAAAILAQALPTIISEQDNDKRRRNMNEILLGLKEKRQELELADMVGGETIFAHVNQEGRVKYGSHGAVDASLLLAKKKTMNHGGPLINKNFPKTKLGAPHKECDPSFESNKAPEEAAITEAEADIGILGCGLQEYCMESGYSSLGGFCVMEDNRGVWDHHVDMGEEDANANAKNASERVLQGYTCTDAERFYDGVLVTCYYDPICLPPCDYTCLSLAYAVYVSYDYNTAFGINCFYVYEPYETVFCYSDLVVLGAGTSCLVSFEGENCDSCSDYQVGDTTCRIFDCSNVIGTNGRGASGNTCEGQLPPPRWETFAYSCPASPTGPTGPSFPTGPTPTFPTGPTPMFPTGPTPTSPTGPTPTGMVGGGGIGGGIGGGGGGIGGGGTPTMPNTPTMPVAGPPVAAPTTINRGATSGGTSGGVVSFAAAAISAAVTMFLSG